MTKSRFAPDSFVVTTERMKWAMDEFNISEKEVDRQTMLWHEWEYARAYSDWGRAWKRWFRQAQQYDKFKREHVHKTIKEVLPKQKEADILAFHAQMKRFGK